MLISPHPDSQTDNIDSIRLEFDAVFSSVFGSLTLNQTAISGFEAAVKSSLASGVNVDGIFTISVLPGSIIVDINGTPTTISNIQVLVNSGKYFVVYDGHIYYLVDQHSGASESSKSLY